MATKGSTKKCAKKTCLKTKPVSDFPNDKREQDGHSVWCKSCWSEYQAARKALKAAPVTAGKPAAVKGKVIAAKSKSPVKVVKAAKASKKESETEAN